MSSFKTHSVLCVTFLVIELVLGRPKQNDGDYLVGVGKGDITGPISDVNMMGYAYPEQIAGGLHTRLYARSFIVADMADPQSRVVFVNLDACMGSQAVTFTVIERLKKKYGASLYRSDNVILSGTHTHSGPGGYLQYLVYSITGLGFVRETFDSLVDGIVLSITRAHDSLQPGKLELSKGRLTDSNINRSPTAYELNPKSERLGYVDDVDKEMTVLRIENNKGIPIGSFSWFPVHGTSMNETNRLINGDNKGAASLFFEREFGDSIVAAFCQSNVGDTTPNTLGAFCIDSGLPCDPVHSTCDGKVQKCVGRGPGWPDHFKSTSIIASKQSNFAKKLFTNPYIQVSGKIESQHMFFDISNIEVRKTNHTRQGKTCRAAMGFAFAAGTTDGPGAFDFTQSDTNGTAFWRLIRDFMTEPSQEQVECHRPKPILLDVGEMHIPYEWAPSIVEIGIFKIGNFVILSVPAEFTTMSGRRLVHAVKLKLEPIYGPVHVVVAGLSNTYASYVTTFEEYQAQRYEGGFTLYGAHTLDAYIQQFMHLADCMSGGAICERGPKPPNLLDAQWSLTPGVVFDTVPRGMNFGDVILDAEIMYRPGQTVTVEFQAASPRNNLHLEGTYLTVERRSHQFRKGIVVQTINWARSKLFPMQNTNSVFTWKVVFTDKDWETKMYWYRKELLSPLSYTRIQWSIPMGIDEGIYRIRYFGDSKSLSGRISPFSGQSSEFKVESIPKAIDGSRPDNRIL